MASNKPNGGDTGEPAADGIPETIERRGRYVLYCLREHGRLALGDIADEVTVWETGRRLPDVSAETARTVYLALYHTHVPRLERADLVAYDADRDLVALSDAGLGIPCQEPERPRNGETAVAVGEDE